MVKFLITKLEMTRTKFFLSTIVADTLLNLVLGGLTIFLLLRSFTWPGVLYVLLTVVYTIFSIHVLAKFLERKDLNSNYNRFFSVVRLGATGASLVGVRDLVTFFELVKYYEGKNDTIIYVFSVGYSILLAVYWVVNIYWSLMLVFRVTTQRETLDENVANDYYRDNDAFQD